MRKIFYATIFIFLFLLIGGRIDVAAAGKFDTKVTREYWVQEDLTVRVREREVVTNNTSNLYIPSGAPKEFQILAIEIGDPENKQILQEALESATLKAGGSSMNFTSSIVGDVAEIKSSYPYSINPGMSITYEFSYTHPGMLEANGALRDFFVNGFSDNSVFADGNNATSYQTILYIPTNYKELNFVNLEPSSKTSNGDYIKYTFGQEDLVGHYIWMQFGKTQYYRFKITQPINNSERLNTGNINNYEIVIPRSISNADVEQTIYYTNISPTPKWVKKDAEGNLLARFELKSNYQGDIVLEGLASITKDRSVDSSNFGNLSDIGTDMSKYLQSAEYWEVDDPAIQTQAKELKGNKTDIGELVNTTYNYVINQIDYSQVKRFGLNERQGAVKTLQGGAAVCMEYSDLFLTLMRAQGVPARAAFGYGYDPKTASDEQESHQWVEIYAPGLDSWVAVDVTWGENGPALIGGDLNHLYTHVAVESPNDPPGVVGYGFGSLDLESARYTIDVLDSIDVQSTRLEGDLLESYPYVEQGTAQEFLSLAESKLDATYSNIMNQESLSADQVAILLTGIILILLFMIIIYKLLRWILKKYKRSNISSDGIG